MNIIETKNLTKYYGDIKGIENLSLQVKKGEIFGFLGPNGAGKTTTIRTLLGLLRPTSGEAYILNKNIEEDIVEIRANVGYIPGELNLYEHLTGRQFLDYFSSLRETNLSLLDELLEIFELPLERKIKSYSRGMKQKMGIIQAFMDDPPVVIMDEPTSGLDPKSGKIIKLKIKEDPSKFKGSKDIEIINGWIEFVTSDDINYWIKEIAKFTVEDLKISDFSLEDIFIRYYKEGE